MISNGYYWVNLLDLGSLSEKNSDYGDCCYCSMIGGSATTYYVHYAGCGGISGVDALAGTVRFGLVIVLIS